MRDSEIKNTVCHEGSISMSKREKVTIEERINAAKLYIEGKFSLYEAARRLGVAKKSVREWVARYQNGGPLAFAKQEHNIVYPESIKRVAAEEYLSGNGSLLKIAAKYGLRPSSQLRDWIKVYNSGKDFKHKMSGGSHMKQGRETTQEERIAIAKECIETGNNYGEIAVKYNVSYQQVYTWVKRYKKLGEAGLEDRRGKRIIQQEPRTELEKARQEIAILKRKLYLAEVERDLLKKLDELERSDAFRR